MRIAEAGVRTGSPMYAPWLLQLTEQEALELGTEIERIGQARLRVVRIVDVSHGHSDPERQYGFHFFALIYGDVILLRSAGLLASRTIDSPLPESLLQDVRRRFLDPDVEFAEREIGADVVDPVARLRLWVTDKRWKDVAGDEGERRSRVRRLAGMVIDVAQEKGDPRVSTALLDQQFGEGATRDALGQSLRQLTADQATNFFKLLYESGRSPSQVETLGDLGDAEPLLVRTPGGIDFVPFNH
jgi:hypothetical protein